MRARPEVLLFLMAFAMPLSHATWMALLNNFVVERAAFTGVEIGILQSIREIPGFLAFAAIFVILVMREQTLALVSLALLGIGTALTGLFPAELGLYATTVLMSLGFHYYETMNQSLTLQWVDKERTPLVMGRMIAIGSAASLLAYGLIFGLMEALGLDYAVVYLLGGGLTFALAIFAAIAFPKFESPHPQRKQIVIRSRYWLYYLLTFFAGARRQIFVVFALFLLVERLGASVGFVTALLIINHIIATLIGPTIGRLVGRFGERAALIVEYGGLIAIFVGYALVKNVYWAGALYVADHIFFAMAIAIRTYFQKIADPGDIAPTAGFAFTINHIAAVIIPVVLGAIWINDPSAVFYAGVGFAGASLVCALLLPRFPGPGHETLLSSSRAAQPVRP